MAWRLARSLERLRDQIRSVHPGTTVWTIGDQDHQSGPSDHNPNGKGVVCAIDVLGNAGLDLEAFAERVRTSGHPAFKYVIFDRRIAFKGGGWQPYRGDNPHTTHVHISVGTGPDGQSTGPYDDTTEWDLEDDMDITDRLTVPGWVRTNHPDLGKTISVQTALASGYGHTRATKEYVLRLEKKVDALTAVVEKLAERLGVPVDAAAPPPSGES